MQNIWSLIKVKHSTYIETMGILINNKIINFYFFHHKASWLTKIEPNWIKILQSYSTEKN